MSQPNEKQGSSNEGMESFFDFDGASFGINWVPMAGGDPACTQNERCRPDCRSSSAPTHMPLHCEDAKLFTGGKLEPGQPTPQVESEAPTFHEFVTLRDIEVLQQNVHRNAFEDSQEHMKIRQPNASIKGTSSLGSVGRSRDLHLLVDADSAAVTTTSYTTSCLSGSGKFMDATSNQRKREHSPPFDVLIPDIFGCSPWTRPRRTEQEQRDRNEVTKAGGSCLLCAFRHKKCSGERPCDNCYVFWSKRVARTTIPQWTCDVYSKFSDLEFLDHHSHDTIASQHHQTMVTKAFEFIRCRSPICGIEYEIVSSILPEKLTTLLWLCFIPLRAFQWKNALHNFDPDLERFIEDAAHTSQPLLRKIFRQCDILFAAKSRDVATTLLGALNREIECIGFLANVNPASVKHMRDMVASRLKVLCPLLLDTGERQRTMSVASAAIVSLDEETATLLSETDMTIVGCIIQLQHSWHEDAILEKLALSIDGSTHSCLQIQAGPNRLGGGSNLLPQSACYCYRVWETIKHDISNFYQITAESISSILHSNIDTTFPVRSDDTEIIRTTLGELLGTVFGQAGRGRNSTTPMADTAMFRRALAFVPEFVFAVLPSLATSENAPATRSQRCRIAPAYRHAILLSVIVQACVLVNQFCRETTAYAQHTFWPFEDWLMKRREADVLDTFLEVLLAIHSINSQLLEGEVNMDLQGA